MATVTIEQARMERFAQLRAANPDMDYDEIRNFIHDEEVNYAEAGHDYTVILSDARLFP